MRSILFPKPIYTPAIEINGSFVLTDEFNCVLADISNDSYLSIPSADNVLVGFFYRIRRTDLNTDKNLIIVPMSGTINGVSSIILESNTLLEIIAITDNNWSIISEPPHVPAIQLATDEQPINI